MGIIHELYEIEHRKQIKKSSRYEIKTSQYCSLLRNEKWLQWLNKIAPDINQKVQVFIRTSNSCKKNREKMLTIQEELKNREKMSDLIKFLKEEFPQMLKPLT